MPAPSPVLDRRRNRCASADRSARRKTAPAWRATASGPSRRSASRMPCCGRSAERSKRNHERAFALWATGIREARLLSLFTDEPKKVNARGRPSAMPPTSIPGRSSITAPTCSVDAGLAAELVPVFAADEREFVRRTAFAMMAWAAVHLKKEPDATYLGWLPLIEAPRRRQPQFREEGGELGAAPDRQALARAASASARTRRTPCRVERQDRALDRQGRGQGTGRCQDAGAAGKERVSCVPHRHDCRELCERNSDFWQRTP